MAVTEGLTEARRIAANIAKLPELLRKPQSDQWCLTSSSAVGWRRGHLLGEAMSPLKSAVAVVIAACVAECAGDRAQIANYAQNKMVGLTKEQVLACMGSPASKATEGATEVWSYPSGNCTANVTMMDGKVKRMNYVDPTGNQLSQNEQCFFTVANCTY